MNDFNYQIIAKNLFISSLAIGVGILISFLLTKNFDFAIWGLIYLIFATILNLIFLLFFLISGFLYKTKYEECMKAILILLINIPIAIACAFIGLSYTH